LPEGVDAAEAAAWSVVANVLLNLDGVLTRGQAKRMQGTYTAIIQRDGPWWIGWLQEIPGVNSQGRTREELIENLRSALTEALELNRAEALAAAANDYEEVSLQV
jgi:predicted RNase H-like HicB family nuclease